MTRPAEWQVEAWEALKSENWNLNDSRCPVRIEPIAGAPKEALGGYFTLCGCINLMTPAEMEKNVGLDRNSLATGARIYRFARLPQISEYTYELTAKYPGGVPESWQGTDWQGNVKWPAGSDKVQQWRLKSGILVRVQEPIDVAPGKKFLLPGTWDRK